MHIASVIVRTRPEDMNAVQLLLGELPGVEVYTSLPDGRLIVTIEADNRSACGERLMAIHAIPRVLSAGLVYEQTDEEITEIVPWA